MGEILVAALLAAILFLLLPIILVRFLASRALWTVLLGHALFHFLVYLYRMGFWVFCMPFSIMRRILAKAAIKTRGAL